MIQSISIFQKIDSDRWENFIKLNEQIFSPYEFVRLLKEDLIHFSGEPLDLLKVSEKGRKIISQYKDFLTINKTEIELYKNLKAKYEGRI